MRNDRHILRNVSSQYLHRGVNSLCNHSVAAHESGRLPAARTAHPYRIDHPQLFGHPLSAGNIIGVEGKSPTRQSRPVGTRPVNHEAVIRRSADECDSPMSQLKQMLHGLEHQFVIVDIENGTLDDLFRSSVQDQRHVVPGQQRHPLVLGQRGDDDKSVHRVSFYKPLIGIDNLIRRTDFQDEVDIVLRELHRQAGQDFEPDFPGRDSEIVRQHHSRETRTAGDELPRELVRTIVQFHGRLMDALPGFLIHVGIAVQRPADGGHRNAQFSANVFQRRHFFSLSAASTPPSAPLRSSPVLHIRNVSNNLPRLSRPARQSWL